MTDDVDHSDDFADLERRLRHIDPCPLDVPVTRAGSPPALAQMRRTMDTDISLEAQPSPPGGSSRRGLTLVLGAAAAGLLVVGGLIVFAGGDDAPDVAEPPALTDSPTVTDPPVATDPPVTDPAPVTVTYQLAASDPLTTMCLPVADAIIPPNSVAFAGTVSEKDGTGVLVDVDHWYTADEGAQVRLTAGTDVSVALDGVDFVVGERYLVTVTDGTVAICGVSGPASPELERLYQEWYG